MAELENNQNVETTVVHAGRPERIGDGAVNPPIVPTSTQHAGGQYGYARDWSETGSYLEEAIGILEGGTALIFSSGMSAASAVFDLWPIGTKVVASQYSYTGVAVRLKELAELGRIELELVDVTENSELDQVINALKPDWVWIETPTNPMMEICDLRYTAKLAHQVGAKLLVDNTFMTPIRQRPIELGADVVMHSVTKAMSGHSDLLMGALVTKDQELVEALSVRRILLGSISSAFDAYLALRGLRTLAVRMDRAEENAQILAERLQNHPAVKVVHYPGLPSHKNAGVAKDQTSGPGSVLSFEVNGTANQTDEVCENVRTITYATSLGGVETLMERRRRWEKENEAVPETLIRLAVGIENVEDLWRDLKGALDQVKR